MVESAQYFKKRFLSEDFYLWSKAFGSFVLCLCLFVLLFTSSVALAEAVNVAPSLDLIGPKSVQENNSLSFTLLATDENNDALQYTSPNLPQGAQLDINSGFFEWIPEYNQSGSYQVEFIASEGNLSDSEYVEITVSNTNRLPQLQPISDYTINETESIEIILVATDIDGDILEYSKSTSFGLITGNKFTWTPSYESAGEHTINFAVNDGVDEVYQTTKITVENVNRKPILFSISDKVVAPDNTINFSLEAYDFDGDSLTFYNETTLPAGSSFNSGYFAWTPSNANNGAEYMLKFNVSDGINYSETKDMRIFVGNSSQPPVFEPISLSNILENESLSFKVNVTGVDLWNDMVLHPDGSSYGLPSLLFEWTPSYEQSGIHLLEFSAQEKSYPDFKVFQHFVLDVQNVNRVPEIDFIIGGSINETEMLVINISATDPDGDSLFYSTDPSLGKFQGNTFIWTPEYSDSGTHIIDFTVSDGELKNSTPVTINVEDTNMPPELDAIGAQTAFFNETLEFEINASDGDNDNLTYAATGLPSGASFNASTQIFSWKALPEQEGEYTIGFSVSDQEFTDYETILLTVKEPVVITSAPSSSGGGGGGGGSQNTGEKFENIDFKEYKIRPVVKDKETVFKFIEQDNPITSIVFTSRLNGGQVKTIIENLKGPTTIVDEVPSGIVYKNMNIWMGDSKFSSDLVYGAEVAFKVEKEWIKNNEIELEHITLCRYSGGAWEYLDTTISDEDNSYVYFTSKTPGFSPFAITSFDLAELISQDQTVNSVVDDVVSDTPENTEIKSPDEQRSLFSVFVLMGLILLLLVGVMGKRYHTDIKGMHAHITNTDGKRYRRIKR